MERALQARPQDLNLRIKLAALAKKAGKLERALELLQKCLPIHPQPALILFNLGNTLHAMQRPAEAIQAYREALARDPKLAAAHFNLGNLLRDQGDLTQAIAAFQQAIQLQPDVPRMHGNLGNVLRQLGRHREAVACHERAVALQPRDADATYNLANALRDTGEHERSIRVYRDVLAINPGHEAAALNLALALESDDPGAAEQLLLDLLKRLPAYTAALQALSRLSLATGSHAASTIAMRNALSIQPDDASVLSICAQFFLQHRQYEDTLRATTLWLRAQPQALEPVLVRGQSQYQAGRIQEAIDTWLQALPRHPDHATLHGNLGAAYGALKQVDRSISHLRRACELAPDTREPRANLAHLLLQVGMADEARRIGESLVATDPSSSRGYVVQGLALVQQARIEEAVQQFGWAGDREPDSTGIPSHRLFALLYGDKRTDQDIAALHRQHGEDVCRRNPQLPVQPRGSGTRLRIGYLSPDFGAHPVGYFMEPILEHHDRSGFEIYCYSDRAGADELTQCLRGHSEHWVECRGMSNAQLAERMRMDDLDLLVDLAGHSAGAERLNLIAQKPARRQAIYLGYPNTSGLPSVDHIIADPELCPGPLRHLYMESPLVPAPCFLCFKPPTDAPEVGPSPCLMHDSVTFGSYNHLPKLSDTTLGLWTAVLASVPRSRLLLKASPFADPVTRELTAQRFERAGIARERLLLTPPTVPLRAFLREYDRVDIALDPYPFNGGTTTCQALWMGVPVVTLAGNSFQSRMGLSILKAVGLSDLIAGSAEEYVRICSALASAPDRLNALRLSLRHRLAASSLCDHAGYTRGLEQAYREAVSR